MDASMFTDVELQVSRERSRKYLGPARIKLQHITPHSSISRELKPGHVERLCAIFRKEGCRRLHVRNHVTAIVARQHLNEALARAGLSADALAINPHDKFPELEFPNKVQCLHGQHRLKAGEEILSPGDQWWIVDLYVDDISDSLQTTLVEEYSNEHVPSDGEIYRKVRQYQHEANARFENRWMARLSSNKAKRLRQLSSNVTVRAAFDSLLMIPALLQQGMMLGSLPRALAVDIPEEMVNALDSLKQYWSQLLKGNRASMLKLDAYTVEKLQLLAPGLSAKETRTVQGLVLSGEVFSNFSDSERRSIWKRMKKDKCIIPTLYTFFQDMWYLEECANGIKQLVTLGQHAPTIRTALFSIHFADPNNRETPIQTTETSFRYCSVSSNHARELAYRQLWLFAMRHYPGLGKPPGGDHLVAKQRCEGIDQKKIHDMAVLALKLGFKSPQIEKLIDESPDIQIARAALLKARGPDQYQYDAGIFDSLVRQVMNCFDRATPIASQSTSERVSEQAKPRDRCGLPRRKAQIVDSRFLFLDEIHGEPRRDEELSAFSVRRSVYFLFFGTSPGSLPESPTEADTMAAGSMTSAPPVSPLFVPVDDQSPEPIVTNAVRPETRDHNQREEKRQQERHIEKQRRKRERRERKTRRREQHERLLHGAGAEQQQQRVMWTPDVDIAMETAGNVEPGIVSPDQMNLHDDANEPSEQRDGVTNNSLRMEPDCLESGPYDGCGGDMARTGHNAQSILVRERGEHRSSEVDSHESASWDRLTDSFAEERDTKQGPTVRQEDRKGRESPHGQQSISDAGTEEEEDGENRVDHLKEKIELELARLQQDANEQVAMNQTGQERSRQEEQQGPVEEEPERTAGHGAAEYGSNLYGSRTIERAGSYELNSKEGAWSPNTEIEHIQPSSHGTATSHMSTIEEDDVPMEAPALTHNQHPPGHDAAISRNTGFSEDSEAEPQPPLLQPSAIRSKDTQKRRNVGWWPYDSSQRNRRGWDAEHSTKQAPEQRSMRRVTQLNFFEARSAAEEQVPVLAGARAAQSPLPPVVSSREEPEEEELLEDGGADNAGTGGSFIEARAATAAKLETQRRLARDRDELSPSADASPLSSRHSSPNGGPSVTPEYRRVRAQKAVTQLDFAAWADGAIESQQGETASPERSQNPSSIEPKQKEAVSRTASPKPTTVAETSTSQAQNRKILTPRIVARAPRTDIAQELSRKMPTTPVTVAFKARDEDGEWRKIYQLELDPSDPTAVERLMKKDARNRGATFYDKDLRMITPAQCYDAAIEDGANTIFVDFGGELAVNEDTLASVTREIATGKDHRVTKRQH